MSKIMISELQETTSAPDSSYIAIDNGTTTNKITVANYNANANATAKRYAEASQGYSEDALTAKNDAISAKNEAETLANTASSYANAARASADAAAGSASEASGYVGSAQTSATNALASARAAEASAAGIDDQVKLAKSWAVGNTGVRADEAVNNSMYWAGQAAAAAGGGVVSFNGRAGSVLPTAGDYSSDQIAHVNSDSTYTNVEAAINNLDSSKLSNYVSDSAQWNSAPTANSNKPVTSGGVHTALAGKVNTSDIANNLSTTTAGKVLDAREGRALETYKTGMSVIATRQANLTASRKYNVGDQFIYAEEPNKIYKATATINKDDIITIGGNASAADNVTTQIGNLIATTSGTCTLDLTNIDTFWYNQTSYSATKSGYTPIAWSVSLSNYAGVTNLQVENASLSNGSINLTFYGSPLAGQAKTRHTVTVRVVWLKNK